MGVSIFALLFVASAEQSAQQSFLQHGQEDDDSWSAQLQERPAMRREERNRYDGAREEAFPPQGVMDPESYSAERSPPSAEYEPRQADRFGEPHYERRKQGRAEDRRYEPRSEEVHRAYEPRYERRAERLAEDRWYEPRYDEGAYEPRSEREAIRSVAPRNEDARVQPRFEERAYEPRSEQQEIRSVAPRSEDAREQPRSDDREARVVPEAIRSQDAHGGKVEHGEEGAPRSQDSLRSDARASPVPKRDMAFVSVFGFGLDPQRNAVYARDDIRHMELWKDSIERLGMSGTVLHDDVYSPQFVSEQHGPVQFQYMDVRKQGLYTDPHLKNLTTSDWRFIALHDYLKEHEHELGYVLLTDGQDVAFRSNPLKYMRSVDDALGHGYVFGQEEWRPRIAMSEENDSSALERMVVYWNRCFKTKMPTQYLAGRMPSCGILGGNVSVVLPFLERMRYWYSHVPIRKRSLMCDMMVYMRTVMQDYQDRFVSGYPFHAKFKNADPRDIAAIYHKHPVPAEPELPQWRENEVKKQPLALIEDLPSFDGPSFVEIR